VTNRIGREKLQSATSQKRTEDDPQPDHLSCVHSLRMGQELLFPRIWPSASGGLWVTTKTLTALDHTKISEVNPDRRPFHVP
jgi:hypothetical protein